ncbi:MAG: ATP-binding protein [Elusimicrobiota bacterium]
MEIALRNIGKEHLKNNRIIKHLNKPDIKIKISRLHIEKLFVNIIKNALESMEGSGTLTITTGKEQDGILIIFADTGKGIKEEDLKKIFEPDYTIHTQKGTGLGLSNSLLIAEHHNGKIEAISEGPGKGTEIRVYLPFKK